MRLCQGTCPYQLASAHTMCLRRCFRRRCTLLPNTHASTIKGATGFGVEMKRVIPSVDGKLTSVLTLVKWKSAFK